MYIIIHVCIFHNNRHTRRRGRNREGRHSNMAQTKVRYCQVKQPLGLLMLGHKYLIIYLLHNSILQIILYITN